VASHRHGGPRSEPWGEASSAHAATGSVPPPIATAWLSLDESDDLIRFLTYLIAALQAGLQAAGQTVDADLGIGALGALQGPQPPPAEVVLTSLINEIAGVSIQIVLVLDDYHLIDGASPARPAVHDALIFLLRRLPPQMHLAITTRVDPPLPLARLRARGQLTEIRAADLRFISAEAAEFLNQVMGLDLSAEDIRALERRTEGWIAGLQLAALALQGTISMRGRLGHGVSDVSGFIQSFTGSHRFVLDYLVEEVLEQQTKDVETFLLQTSILDRLTGSLCDAVQFDTGRLRGAATLEMLEHANLFIVPLDEERRWYRYHHLFADLLRRRLNQAHPERVSTLHSRASQWYEQNGFADEAIEHALRANDFERAAHLLQEHVGALWGRGEHDKLQNWMARLPVEWIYAKPHLCIFYAWYLFARGQHDAAYRARLEATELSRSAGNPFYLIATHVKLAMTLRELGQLQRMIELCEQQWQLAERSGLSQASLVGLLLAIWGEVLAEVNDLSLTKNCGKSKG
jgi:LuxR family maltose regulon positive regulatory protein